MSGRRMVVTGAPTWPGMSAAGILSDIGSMMDLVHMTPADPRLVELPLPVWVRMSRGTSPRPSRGFRRHIRKQKAAGHV